MREPWIAGLLSLFIPGLGQIYNGRVLIGIIWFVITFFTWIGALGWILHIISAWCAYSFAKDNPVRD